MEEEKEVVADDKEVTEDYTESEDAELWRWRQISLKRGSTLIPSEEEEGKDDTFKEENSADGFSSNQAQEQSQKEGILSCNRRTSYASQKQQSLNFELTGHSNIPNTPQSHQSKRPMFLAEEDSYRSMSALDQLKLFQEQQDQEMDGLSPLPTSPGSSALSRPKTTGRLGGRSRSKSRRSQSIFGQGAPLNQGN